ncbi:hypothetical protein KQH24_31755, partial [Streptomyces sp. CHB9.2]|nr:hypothetical protein [Streptomyces sp. CHB9.2]
MAYILGQQGFWSLDLEVSPDTLIPRPDTEVLVETALALPLAAAPGVEGSLSAVQGDARVAKALEALRADDGRTFTEQKHIAQIPAPPFKEKVRAEYYLKRFQELGLKDASIAPEGYVIATRKGSGQGPQLVVSAHLDTVFPEGTDL